MWLTTALTKCAQLLGFFGNEEDKIIRTSRTIQFLVHVQDCPSSRGPDPSIV